MKVASRRFKSIRSPSAKSAILPMTALGSGAVVAVLALTGDVDMMADQLEVAALMVVVIMLPYLPLRLLFRRQARRVGTEALGLALDAVALSRERADPDFRLLRPFDVVAGTDGAAIVVGRLGSREWLYMSSVDRRLVWVTRPLNSVRAMRREGLSVPDSIFDAPETISHPDPALRRITDGSPAE